MAANSEALDASKLTDKVTSETVEESVLELKRTGSLSFADFSRMEKEYTYQQETRDQGGSGLCDVHIGRKESCLQSHDEMMHVGQKELCSESHEEMSKSSFMERANELRRLSEERNEKENLILKSILSESLRRGELPAQRKSLDGPQHQTRDCVEFGEEVSEDCTDSDSTKIQFQKSGEFGDSVVKDSGDTCKSKNSKLDEKERLFGNEIIGDNEVFKESKIVEDNNASCKNEYNKLGEKERDFGDKVIEDTKNFGDNRMFDKFGNKAIVDSIDICKNKYNQYGEKERQFGEKVIGEFEQFREGKVVDAYEKDDLPYDGKPREKYNLRDYNGFHGDADFCDTRGNFPNSHTKLPDTQAAPDFPDADSGKGWGGCMGEDGPDSDWDWERGRPAGERWPPLGAPNDDEDNLSLCSYSELSWQRSQYGQDSVGYRGSAGAGGAEEERLQQLEEEQEQLNNSLMALTSHFAQVQFRLKQIVDAGPSEKEELLRQLEEFANRGIPDLREVTASRSSSRPNDSEQDGSGGDGWGGGVGRQKELIARLKQQLEDLEDYVYKSGQGGPPQSSVMEKQRVIIEQLKGKLNLNVDEFDKLTVDDLRVQVDHAIRELINPLKMKEQLVAQLQTQITDLERFIDFLQGEGPKLGRNNKGVKGTGCQCESPVGRHPGDGKAGRGGVGKDKHGPRSIRKDRTASDKEQLRQETENLVKRATTLMKMLSFGCGAGQPRFRSNTLKKTPRGNHYGDLRARLEVGINSVIEVLESLPSEDTDEASSDDPSSSDSQMHQHHPQLTAAIRKALAPPLRDLIQHGLMPVGQSQSLVPFLSCFPHRESDGASTQLLHAWDLILRYYHLHNGHRYNHTPARSLSQSFNLEITGGTAVTNKQSLLAAVGSIISTHTPLKRSHDAHFKAFVSAALNQKKLITWLRLIFRTQSLTENYYQSWSYVSQTGFEDAFRSLDRLSRYNFNLPIDLAIRPFNNIKDAF